MGLRRTAELRRTGPPRRKRRLAWRSQKRIELSYGDYVTLRLARSKVCEVGEVIAREADPVWVDLHCARVADGLHHLRKRSAAGRVKSRLNTMRSCSACNAWVEDHPMVAHEVGLAVRPGDPWWRWLGVRLPSGRTL